MVHRGRKEKRGRRGDAQQHGGEHPAAEVVELVEAGAEWHRRLQDWVKPGRNLDIRFTFDHAGTLELAVPVDSCPTQQSP